MVELDPALLACPGFALSATARAADALFATMLRPLALTPPLYATLVVLREAGPHTQSALAVKTGIDRATMVKIVDALEELTFAARVAHPTDQRAVLVSLSAAGEEAVSRARVIEVEAQERLLEPLGPDERVQLVASLRIIASGLRADRPLS